MKPQPWARAPLTVVPGWEEQQRAGLKKLGERHDRIMLFRLTADVEPMAYRLLEKHKGEWNCLGDAFEWHPKGHAHFKAFGSLDDMLMSMAISEMLERDSEEMPRFSEGRV